MNKSTVESIVIVGGGAGGLVLATLLGRKFKKNKKVNVTLVDCSLIHVWKPLLHEVAAGTLNELESEIEYYSHAYNNNYHFEYGKLYNINRANRTLTLQAIVNDDGKIIVPQRQLNYDKLVIAIGSVSNNFSIPGADKYCYYLDSYYQSKKFQQNILQFLLNNLYRQQDTERANKTIAIIGGGATGVELGAELHYSIQLMKKYQNNRANFADIKIIIIESSDRILMALPERISTAAQGALTKKDIQVLTKQRVTEITSKGIVTNSGQFIAADMTIWAAGIKGDEILRQLDGLEVTKLGQLIVNSKLNTIKDPNIYALGDCAAYDDPHYKKIVPARAQAAYQQAKFLYHNFCRELGGKKLHQFYYHDYGSIIILSRKTAIGNLMGNIGIHLNFTIEGLWARWAYKWLYKRHMAVLMGWWKVILLAISNCLLKSWRSRLKLH